MTTQAALSDRLKNWLDGTESPSGNPFAKPEDFMLGSRLKDLSDLFTSGSGTGASMIPILDAAGLYTALQVETALLELRTTLISKSVADVTTTAGGSVTVTQAAMTVRGAGGLADNVDTVAGGVLTSWGFFVTGAEAITYRDAAVSLTGNISTPRDASLVTATGDIVLWVLSGTTYRIVPLLIQGGYPLTMLGDLLDAGSCITATTVEGALQEIFLLARGNTYYGGATGKLSRADIKALGAILAGDGADAVVVNLLSAALGGTGFALRSYAAGTLQEPAEDATLTAALGSLMLLRRDAMARLLLDDATPSATAGRGLVVSGSGVTAQAAPDASVIVASGVAFNQLGRRVLCTSTPVLAVTTPNGLGGVRNDIVVIPAAGGAPVVREGSVIATDPVLTAGDVPLARLRCPNGAVTITGAEIDDLRQTTRTIPADKLLPASTADLLVLLATDQITNAVLLQAIPNGAFQADAPTRALFADLIWTDAKLAQDRGKTAGFWLGFTGGATDITGGAATRDFKVTIDGTGPTNLTIDKTGLDTGAKIAAAMQVAIRAAGGGIWPGYDNAEVRYDAGTLRYICTSGTRGSTSSATMEAGTANDLCTSLKLLAADNAVTFPGCDNLDHARAQLAGLVGTLDTTALLRMFGTDQITNAVLLQAVLNGAFSADTATRALFGAGFINERLLSAAIKAARAHLVMEETSPPTATAGRGLVTSGCGVTPQAAPDNTVIVAAGTAINHLGEDLDCDGALALAATTPNGLGGNRYDVVVLPAGGGAPVIREGTIITTDPILTAGDVPLARLTCAPGAFTIAGGDIADLRQAALSIDPSKFLPSTTADLLIFLATDQVTNAVLIQAILNGAFQADAATRALFQDHIWPVAKMEQGVMLEVTGTIPGGTGAGKVGSLNSNPVNVIAAPAAGEIIIIDEDEWFLDYGGVAYDSVAAGDLLTLVYTGDTTALVAGLSTGFGDAVADAHRVVGPVSPPITTPIPSVGVDAYCAAGDWYAAAGNSPVKYRIRYHIVTMLS